MIIITRSVDKLLQERLSHESLGKRVERTGNVSGLQDRNIERGWTFLPLVERLSVGITDKYYLKKRELTLSILAFSGVIPDGAVSYQEESGDCYPIQTIISRSTIVHRQIHTPHRPGFDPYATNYYAYASLFKDVKEGLEKFAEEFIRDIFTKFKDENYSGEYGLLYLSNYDVKILVPYSEVGCKGDTNPLLYPGVVRPTLLDLGYEVIEK